VHSLVNVFAVCTWKFRPLTSCQAKERGNGEGQYGGETKEKPLFPSARLEFTVSGVGPTLNDMEAFFKMRFYGFFSEVPFENELILQCLDTFMHN